MALFSPPACSHKKPCYMFIATVVILCNLFYMLQMKVSFIKEMNRFKCTLIFIVIGLALPASVLIEVVRLACLIGFVDPSAACFCIKLTNSIPVPELLTIVAGWRPDVPGCCTITTFPDKKKLED